jgi:MurNAc alpha-1-phosphate uridylyltransferase
MRPLTDHVPKPLLKVGGKCLIEFHLEKLAAAGIRDVVINTHWLAEQIPAALGSGERWGLRLHYSHEPELLETAGGIVQALSTLTEDGEAEFLLVNGDVYCEVDFASFLNRAAKRGDQHQAHLALVDNPDHNPSGDFVLGQGGELSEQPDQGEYLTYAGLALFHRDFFRDLNPGPSLLGPLLKQAIRDRKVGGEHIRDYWLDVGTPERLQSLNDRAAKS